MVTPETVTHEPEITEPVLLCTPDGKHLDPAARGWSRVPLHDANLRGVWGRTKTWDYWAVLAGDLVISATYADVDYLGMASTWWANLRTGRTGGRDLAVPGAPGFSLPSRCGTTPLRHRSKALDLDMVDDDRGTTITARWTEADGTTSTLDVLVELPAGHESVNVVIPWSDTRFQFTSKHQARPAHGTLTIDGEVHEIGGADDPAWGVLDVGRGRWPYRTNWNWGGGAGVAVDGTTVVGLQFGAKWTAGTGFTENGIIVDGRLTKIGAELDWDYAWEHPLRPWRVRHPDGSLDLTLAPRYDKHSKTSLGIMGMEVHQVFGAWSGHVTTDEGVRVEVDGLQGFAEESRSRW